MTDCLVTSCAVGICQRKLLLSAYRHLGPVFLKPSDCWMLKQKGLYKRSGNGWGARFAVVLALIFKHFFRYSQYQPSVQHIHIQEHKFVTKACCIVLHTHKPLRKCMPVIHGGGGRKNSTAWVMWMYYWCNITIHMFMTLAVRDSCCSWSSSVCLSSTFNWTPCIVILASHLYLVHPNIQGYAVQILARLSKPPWISYNDYSCIPVM